MRHDSQYSLIRQVRFFPFFITQFLGAFNDNLFKSALIMFITFFSVQEIAQHAKTYSLVIGGLLILPFFLFSATAGQIAERYEKSRLIRVIKLFEILLVCLVAIAFAYQSIPWLLVLIFLLGTQSSFFGPVKYSILPQHLSEAEIVGGNGLVEMGTYVAILVGTIVGGLIIKLDFGIYVLGVFLITCAVCGYFASRFIPHAPANQPDLTIRWNIFVETWHLIQFSRENRVVFLSILGASWFWALGAVYVSLLPDFVKKDLHYNIDVTNFLFAFFSVGIGIGSLLCERLSGQKVEIGLVPFGSIGLTLFGLDLYFAIAQESINAAVYASAAADTANGSRLLTFGQFIGYSEGGAFSFDRVRFMFDLFMIGMFGGFYSVPLYALIQTRSEPHHRSRIIAGNNVINALFIVVLAFVCFGLLEAGVTIPQIFLMFAVFNAVVAVYIYGLVPEFLMRFLVWILIHTVYRVHKSGLDNIPDRGAVVLVCNHVSYVDALVIAGCIRRPARFVMYHKIFKLPVLRFIFKTAKAISIAPAHEDEALLQEAFDQIDEALKEGNVLCIFPEGKLTADGNINSFKTGIERIIERSPVPVIPMALRGLWDSAFSRKPGSFFIKLVKKIWGRVDLVVGQPLMPEQVKAGVLYEQVAALRGDVK